MNTKEVIEKSEEFFNKLKWFRETIDYNIVETVGFYNSVEYAKILKEISQFIRDNREVMKEVFCYMKISLKNEARRCLQELEEEEEVKKINGTIVNLKEIIDSFEKCSRKVSGIKFLFEHLDKSIKILNKPTHTFRNYNTTIDRYLNFSGGLNGKRPMERKIGKSFRTTKKNVRKLLEDLEPSRFNNTNFEYFVVTSGCLKNLEEEIIIDEKYLRNYSNYNHYWLNADNDK